RNPVAMVAATLLPVAVFGLPVPCAMPLPGGLLLLHLLWRRPIGLLLLPLGLLLLRSALLLLPLGLLLLRSALLLLPLGLLLLRSALLLLLLLFRGLGVLLVLVLLGVRGSKHSKKKEHNSRADKSNWFHEYYLHYGDLLCVSRASS